MTKDYYFRVGFEKLRVAAHPSDIPTIDVINRNGGALVVTAQPVTKEVNIPGLCTYKYTGADGLLLLGRVHTTDTSMDQQDLFCEDFSSQIQVVSSLSVSSAQALTAASGSLAVLAGYTFDQTVDSDSLEDLANADKMWMALKRFGAADSESLLYIKKDAGATVEIRADGHDYATLAHASLTVTGSAGDWHIAIHFDEAVTSMLFGTNDLKLTAGIKALVGANTVAVWQDQSNDLEGGSTVTDGVVRDYS